MNELIYLGPGDPGPPPRGWRWAERVASGTYSMFIQIGDGGSILVPWPPVCFGQRDLEVATQLHNEARARGE